MASQYFRPRSDISTGNWTTSPLYSKVNEASYSDAEYIQINNSTSTTCEMALTNTLLDPLSATGHILTTRVKKTGTGTISITGYLFQGATQIATTGSITLTTSYATTTYTLTAAEANAITDYTDLRVKYTGVAASSSRYAFISWVQFETPAVAQNNQPGYLKGKSTSLDNTFAYLKGKNTLTDNQAGYLKGSITVIDNQYSYVSGLGTALHPDGDIGKTGSWVNEAGGSTLYSSIDETIFPNDSDYVTIKGINTNDYFEVSLQDPAGTPTPSTVIITWRAKSAIARKLKMELRQGSNLIASSEQTVPGDDTFAKYSYSLTSGEILSISNWNDLRIKFIYTGVP